MRFVPTFTAGFAIWLSAALPTSCSQAGNGPPAPDDARLETRSEAPGAADSSADTARPDAPFVEDVRAVPDGDGDDRADGSSNPPDSRAELPEQDGPGHDGDGTDLALPDLSAGDVAEPDEVAADSEKSPQDVVAPGETTTPEDADATDPAPDTGGQETGPCIPACGACGAEDGCGGFCMDSALCNDGNSCTVDYCHEDDGCISAPIDSSCDDADLCTTDDACTAGVCIGIPVACAAGEACVDGTCQCLSPCGDKTCGADGCGNPCGECGPGFACSPEGACLPGSLLCPPGPPFGTQGGDTIADVELQDCDGNPYHLHDLCAKKVSWIFLFAGF